MEIKKFRGIRNTSEAERLAPGYLAAADNVDVDDSGQVRSRLGTSVVNAAGAMHSLWAEGDVCLVTVGQDLRRVNPDYSLTQLTRLTTSRRLSYARQQNVIYYSNGVDRGRVTSDGAVGWGLETPVGQPAAAPTSGGLPPGRYRYALTFRRADGFESGTGIAGVVELPAQGGIQFSGIEVSSEPEVVDKCIYISGPNGEEMFRGPVVDNSVTSVAYRGTGSDLTAVLETQFEDPPPPGDIVEWHGGHMYVVTGSTAYYSAPYQYERFCLRDRHISLPGLITMWAPVADGIYASAAGKTWFLAGTDPRELKATQVFDHEAIPGTATRTIVGVSESEEESPEGEKSSTAVLWTSTRGICLGGEGGRAENLTDRIATLPGAPRGSGLVLISERGYTQYLAALEGG